MARTILFQGDSITDVGRREDPEGLGNGYVREIAKELSRRGGEGQVLNRGISGDRTIDLVGRWEEDCIRLQPDLLTILIGINDCWRKYDSNQPTSIGEFEGNYRVLLDRARTETKAELILMEPFVLPVPEDRRQWRETLDPQIQVVRGLAKEYGAKLIPLDAVFAVAAVGEAYAALADDGVHPTPLGHRLIARQWLIASGYGDKQEAGRTL